MRMGKKRGEISLAVKVAYTLFLCVLVPAYLEGYGPSNFLWFSDVALITLLFALWLESALLASMAAVGILLISIGWNLDFFSGGTLLGKVDYMFDPAEPLHLRALSLFHVGLPLLPLWMVHRLGYDARAFVAQSGLMAVVLLVSYFVTDPAVNINWVLGVEAPQDLLHPLFYLLLLALGVTLFLYLPAHLVLRLAYGRDAHLWEGWTRRWRKREP